MEQTLRKYKTPLGDICYWITYAKNDAQWLVFLPGLSADHTLFDRQIEDLSDTYNCFVWDAPAHGLSRPFEKAFDMFDMADYLHDIFKQEGIVRPVFIGQSLGGYISQVYMERYPNSVSGFISIDSCPMKRKYYSWWEIALMKRTKWMYLSIPWKLLLWWGIAGTATTEYGREIMRKCWSVYGKIEFCELADFGYRILMEAVEAKLPYDITCPALLICGEKDMAGSAKSYNKRWTKQDGIPLVWIKRAGHNANTDAPEKVNTLIREFVSGL